MNCHRAVLPLTLAVLWLAGCTSASTTAADNVDGLLRTWTPTPALLLGEQHDAPEHQALQLALVQRLASEGRLAAVVLEMAERGQTSGALTALASESDVQASLAWSPNWPWVTYGPMVMAAVHARVPVLGGNLPRAGMREAMGQTALDDLLAPALLAEQRDNIRMGHCDLLPATQIAPMTRIQIARDQAMARTLVHAIDTYARAGQSVLLIAGNGHVRRDLGVPQFLPDGLDRTVVMAIAATQEAAPQARPQVQADHIWNTAPRPVQDHCAQLVPAARPDARPGAATMLAP